MSSEPTVFTNLFSMAFGDNDVQITFGVELRTGESKVAAPQVTVVMTPRSAKILAHTLAAAIAQFESKGGLITMPAGKLEGISDELKKQTTKSNAPVEPTTT